MTERISTALEYYAHPTVGKALLRNIGCEGDLDDVDLTDDSCIEHLGKAPVEYLTLTSKQIADTKSRPGKSIQKTELPKILREARESNQVLEVQAPIGYYKPVENGLPVRSLFFLDIEAYDNNDPRAMFRNPVGTYNRLEGAYQTVSRFLAQNNVDAILVMSGRGYHAFSHTTYRSATMLEVMKTAGELSPEIKAALSNPDPNSKRDTEISVPTEEVYWGLRQIEHFSFVHTIRDARKASNVPVEMSDRGRSGVSLDPTSMNRYTETAKAGLPGSIYTKPQVKYGIDGKWLTRSVRAVIIDGEIHTYADNIPQLLEVRSNYNEAVNNLAWLLELSPQGVPEGSGGLAELIALYQKSELARFHSVMNTDQRLSPDEWQDLVGGFKSIAKKDDRVARAATHPYPLLLEPDSLNDFIFALVEHWGDRGLHAFKDVERIISGFYYNNQHLLQSFGYDKINWGKTFNHEVPQRHAQAWVTILGGQLFEPK